MSDFLDHDEIETMRSTSHEPGEIQFGEPPISLEQANAQMQRFLSEQAEMRRNAALGYAATVGHETIDDLIYSAQRVYDYLLNGVKPLDEG